jgi:hypothetical protein
MVALSVLLYVFLLVRIIIQGQEVGIKSKHLGEGGTQVFAAIYYLNT